MNTITAWDHLEDTVDHLADVVDTLLTRNDELPCALEFTAAEALADVLDAGRHTDTATRLIHWWALTEPDWDLDHGERIRHWLAREPHPR